MVFQLELKDRNYVLRAIDGAEAQKWVHRLSTIRDKAQANTIPEEPPSPTGSRSTSRESAAKPGNSNATSPDVEKGDWGKKESKCCIIL